LYGKRGWRPGKVSILQGFAALLANDGRGDVVDEVLLAHLSPLRWEYINLTGDYVWRPDGGLRHGNLRPLRLGPRSGSVAALSVQYLTNR